MKKRGRAKGGKGETCLRRSYITGRSRHQGGKKEEKKKGGGRLLRVPKGLSREPGGKKRVQNEKGGGKG